MAVRKRHFSRGKKFPRAFARPHCDSNALASRSPTNLITAKIALTARRTRTALSAPIFTTAFICRISSNYGNVLSHRKRATYREKWETEGRQERKLTALVVRFRDERDARVVGLRTGRRDDEFIDVCRREGALRRSPRTRREATEFPLRGAGEFAPFVSRFRKAPEPRHCPRFRTYYKVNVALINAKRLLFSFLKRTSACSAAHTNP